MDLLWVLREDSFEIHYLQNQRSSGWALKKAFVGGQALLARMTELTMKITTTLAEKVRSMSVMAVSILARSSSEFMAILFREFFNSFMMFANRSIAFLSSFSLRN